MEHSKNIKLCRVMHRSFFFLMSVVLCSCSRNEAHSWFSGETKTVPLAELKSLKVFNLKGGGILITQTMVNSMVSEGGLRLSFEVVNGSRAAVFSFYGFIGNHEVGQQEVSRIFRGKAGKQWIELPTVTISPSTIIYYQDEAGLHPISIERHEVALSELSE